MTLEVLLAEVMKRGASDLHIGTGSVPRLRIDGRLILMGNTALTNNEIQEMVRNSLGKNEKKLERFLTERELDYSFTYSHEGKPVRFRGNCFFESKKMAAAFRLIPGKIPSIEELEMPRILKEICQKRRGLFLVTGPTGSGKSTTLASMVHEVNKTREEHIITIEDPIEFVHTSVKSLIHQREVGSDTLTFAEGLRRALRQDPDVILIGEMRDLETIGAAVTAGETGHFVLATLHTQDAAQSIDRIVDAFPAYQQQQVRMQLASTLVGICSQQLIPKKNGGRCCAAEILISNSAVKNCIKEGKTSQIKSLIQTGLSIGMQTMEQSLVELVNVGKISVDNAMTYAYDTKDLGNLL